MTKIRWFDTLKTFSPEEPLPARNGLLDVTRRYLAGKMRQAKEASFLIPGHRPPADPGERLPPGQNLVRKWPVLDLHIRPKVDLNRWRLIIDGLVARPLTLNWSEFQALPRLRLAPDIHCVTSWSRFDMDFEGVPTRWLLDEVQPKAEARYVLAHSLDGYTTNLTLEQLRAENALIADRFETKPLNGLHGGPARLIVPGLYFWKSAKWLRRIEIRSVERLGFWETRGYHRNGDPWRQERYSRD